MKRIITAIIALSLVYTAFAQSKYKVVTIQSEQSFYLNGGTRAAFGGKSRVSLNIELPTNTVEWYYVFSTSPNKEGSQSIQLAAQLTKLLDPTGVTAIAMEAILAPTGSGTADVYLIQNTPDLNAFIAKEGGIRCFLNDSRENFKQGTVQIKDNIKGPYYIGIRNPSATEGINVTIEVAAIVKETTEAHSEAQTYGDLGWREYQGGNYDKSIEYSKKALGLDSTMSGIQFNLAIAYLVGGLGDAIDAYVKGIGINKKSDKPKEHLAIAINKIDEAKKKNVQLKDADMIRQLLMDEYKKYQ